MVYGINKRIEQEVVIWEILVKFPFNIPESITVDASQKSVLLKENPSRNFFLLYQINIISLSDCHKIVAGLPWWLETTPVSDLEHAGGGST